MKYIKGLFIGIAIAIGLLLLIGARQGGEEEIAEVGMYEFFQGDNAVIVFNNKKGIVYFYVIDERSIIEVNVVDGIIRTSESEQKF